MSGYPPVAPASGYPNNFQPPVSPPGNNSAPYSIFPNPAPYPSFPSGANPTPYPPRNPLSPFSDFSNNQQTYMMDNQSQQGYPSTGTYPVGNNQSQPGFPSTGTYPVGDSQSQPGFPSTGAYPVGGNHSQPGIPSTGTYPVGGNQSLPGIPSTGTYPVGDNQSQPGYPSTGTYPTGGYPNTGAGSPPPVALPAVSPTAPDLSDIQKIPGYEQISFKEEIVQPPISPVWQPDQQEQKQFENLPSMTEEQVREAAGQFASEHCCYGGAVVRDMDVKEISMRSAFHYKLETFTEKRESAWRFEPYNGQAIDGPMNGLAPAPWDVAATPPSYFSHGKIKMEVPHTAYVKPCHTCVGNGRIRCDSCVGNGRKQCTWCKGRGRKQRFDNEEMCDSCNGTGFDRCFTCSGTGQVKCKTCSGKGNLKGFVELIITWTNHVEDYISETQSMPKELVREVSGQVAYEEENPRVWPISHSPDQAVNNASNELVTKHSRAFTNERILKQRHCLRLIPIAEVNYQWKDRLGQYYVYGYEHKVYFSDYPQKCCCCSIL